MTIFALDDEKAMLEQLKTAIEDAVEDAEIYAFMRVSEALSAMDEQDILPDVVFTDIEMPGMNGLLLAVEIKKRAPQTRIVFVTGYSQYALEAYRHHVNGYLIKPVDESMIREELCAMQSLPLPSSDRLQVQCFGNFELYWTGVPLCFTRKQTKEFFAYLVDRRSICTAEEVGAAMWEDDNNVSAVKTRIRALMHDMKKTLLSIGMETVLIRKRGMIGLRTDMLDCDYYRFLQGDIRAVNAYHGEYMCQYSWAELTQAQLTFAER